MKTMRLPLKSSAPFLKGTLTTCVMLALWSTAHADSSAPVNITDPFVKQQTALSVDKIPAMPAPGSYGMDKATGKFTHPVATPFSHEGEPFAGELDYWDTKSYIKNMTVEAYYPITVEPFHTWQNIVDFDGKRYLYQYVRRNLKIFDITHPKDVKLVFTKGSTWVLTARVPKKTPTPLTICLVQQRCSGTRNWAKTSWSSPSKYGVLAY